MKGAFTWMMLGTGKLLASSFKTKDPKFQKALFDTARECR
jgi:hypothetical protein